MSGEKDLTYRFYCPLTDCLKQFESFERLKSHVEKEHQGSVAPMVQEDNNEINAESSNSRKCDSFTTEQGSLHVLKINAAKKAYHTATFKRKSSFVSSNHCNQSHFQQLQPKPAHSVISQSKDQERYTSRLQTLHNDR
ncbi:uncharacterized protein BYT42DRAFT_570895 [Radiomyces spectabilis]|uniref:uncharacterized protein n=1 Tax=Radiomyces spectabilis TaxID=64574 RepID=UPI00221F2EF3|nr:uncharacterized protein BYT42DRAFT_570895 [Radiomyces spectabilis]KAI8377597.1 hypothetical protein BYT42DRAFT_570895 [Radiomyces spectabilis]